MMSHAPDPGGPADQRRQPVSRGDARIHNIGYRGYSGPRLGRGWATRSLFEYSLRSTYGLGRSGKSKILPFGLFTIMVVPALVMVAVSVATKADELPFDYAPYLLVMQPITGLYLALAAPQLVSLDLRYRTIPLYFSRPLTRRDYVLAKVAALSCALFLFAAVPMLLMYVVAALGELDFGTQTELFAQGLATAVVFAVLHAAIALLVASLTPRRGFGVAAVIAIFTVPYFAAGTVQLIAVEAGNPDAVAWLGLLSPGTLVDGFQGALLGGATEFPDGVVPSTGVGLLYLLVIVVLTALSWALLLRRYRKAGI